MYFEISGTNVRIMGSMHLFPAGSDGLPAWAEQAYKWCENLIFESDQADTLAQLHPPVGRSLQEQLSPATWKTLQDFWPKPGQSLLPPLESIQPWAAVLFTPLRACSLVEGVESLFRHRAAQDNKAVRFLESGAECAAAFDTAPIDEIIQSLELFASNASAFQPLLVKMYDAWIRQDLHGVFDARLPAVRLPGIHHAALTVRNRAWVPVLEAVMDTDKRTLIAVGALHFCGPGNVLELLGRDLSRLR